MSQCGHCGTGVDPADSYCGACGSSLYITGRGSRFWLLVILNIALLASAGWFAWKTVKRFKGIDEMMASIGGGPVPTNAGPMTPPETKAPAAPAAPAKDKPKVPTVVVPKPADPPALASNDKPAAAEPGPAKLLEPARPAMPKPVGPTPVEPKPVAPKPVQPKPVEPKPVAAKPTSPTKPTSPAPVAAVEPTKPAKPGQPTEVQVQWQYTEDNVAFVVRHYRKQLGLCYDRALKFKPDLSGTVELQLRIARNGRIDRIRVVRDTTGSAGLAACVMGRMRTWRFPRPFGGPVELIYPFVFSR